MARINVQCENCGNTYNMQWADGMGVVGLTIHCPCGAITKVEVETPAPPPGEALGVRAVEQVHSKDKFGG